MSRISCFLKDYESFGVFIGCCLNLHAKNERLKYKITNDFYNEVSIQLERFLERNDYSFENIEKWFTW